MQKQTPPKATKTVYPILRQIVNLIPGRMFFMRRRPQQGTSRGRSRRGAMSSRSSTSSSRRRSRSTASATRRGSTPSRNATVPFEVETELQQTRGSRTSRRLVRRSIVRLLEMYGTAGGWKSDGAKPKPLYLQGFLPFSLSPMGQHLAQSQEIPELGCNITCCSTLLR